MAPHQFSKGIVRIFFGISPEQFDVIRFVHLPVNVRCGAKVPEKTKPKSAEG
jgi:hypothetical protein